MNTVLSQGMNPKKKHEVEIMSSLVSFITRGVGARTVVDVGAGQGYLTQVLAFQYQLCVVAIDASSHHGVVSNARAERIKKHYLAKLRKFGLSNEIPTMPKTVTCRVLSSGMFRNLGKYYKEEKFDEKELDGKCFVGDSLKNLEAGDAQSSLVVVNDDSDTSLVLAGLHACGDLSVTMLRAFSECEEIKAMVSVGCCYNLLSEQGHESGGCDSGFPMSNGVRFMGISLGKNARDLACQSAERWRDLEKDAGIQNFDLHAFRAAFQLVLDRYFPQVILTCPSVGRQGKALRRQERRRLPNWVDVTKNEPSKENLDCTSDGSNYTDQIGGCFDKYYLFEKFSYSGLCRLGANPLLDMDLCGLWSENLPFLEQETVSEVVMLPIFDPALSPRNLAIIARKPMLARRLS